MVANGYDSSVPKDNVQYHMANVTSAGDSNGTATHTSSDVSASSSSTPLTRKEKQKLHAKLRRAARRQRAKAQREMEMANNAMHDGPTSSGHSNPNCTANDNLGADTDGSTARLSNHAPTVPSSRDLSSTDPSSAPSNPVVKRRMRSRSPEAAPAAKRQKEAAEIAMSDEHLTTSNSDPNNMMIDAPGANNDDTATDPSSQKGKSKSLYRIQKDKVRSKIRWGAKRYKEKQMRLAQEALAGSPLTESNQPDPNHMPTNDVPGTDSGGAAACLSGDGASIRPILRRKSDALHITGLHSAGVEQ